MARATEKSRQQHVGLRRLAEELLVLLDATPIAAEPLQQTIRRLATALEVHVAMEVDGLYSQLLEHPDDEIRTLARGMIHQLKDVYDGFITFRDAWTADKIASSSAIFVRQARFVAKALLEITQREEEQLYERVDAAYRKLTSE